VADQPPGDSRSIENPGAPSDMPDELEEAVRSDADHSRPVQGEDPGDAGESGEKVSRAGEGLVTEEGVNEPGTKSR